MKHVLIILSLAFTVAACDTNDTANSDKQESAANEPDVKSLPTACECVDTYKTGDTAEKQSCDSLRKDENFDNTFRKCLAASITGKDPDQVNFLKEGDLRVEIPSSGTFVLDSERSVIGWVGKKVLYSHNGEVKLKKGKIQFDGGMISAADIVLDMTSMKNKDLDDEEERAKLMRHLKSPDFFDVEKHPEASFVLKSSEIEAGKGKAQGDLTLKGITRNTKVQNLIIARSGDKNVVVTGIMMIDRTDFDVRYGSGKFFDNLGDNLIKDEIIINFKLRGKLAEEAL